MHQLMEACAFKNYCDPYDGMMAYPRSHLVDHINGGYYHVISRCVRRAQLCGFDSSTGLNFDHRKDWIEQRILFLSQVFSVAIYGYAVMNNHYHLVIKVDPQQTSEWTKDEILDRWEKLCARESKHKTTRNISRLTNRDCLKNSSRIEVLRNRLGNLSWFMKYLNEPLARWANKEDSCTGHFWEGRFKSQALLDEIALLSCMAYVELNPVRAGTCKNLDECNHTSVYHRINSASHSFDKLLKPIVSGYDQRETLPILLSEYIELIHWTSEAQSNRRLSLNPPKIKLTAFSVNHEQWLLHYMNQHQRNQRAFGLIHRLREYANMLGQNWIRNQNSLRTAG